MSTSRSGLCRQICLGFHGPFRRGHGSRRLLKGDKKTYPDGPGQCREALREVALDLAEGADSVMVSQAAYLGIILRVKDAFQVPVFAYQVSGEYAIDRSRGCRGGRGATRWCSRR